jgi:hypothetical protein
MMAAEDRVAPARQTLRLPTNGGLSGQVAAELDPDQDHQDTGTIVETTVHISVVNATEAGPLTDQGEETTEMMIEEPEDVMIIGAMILDDMNLDDRYDNIFLQRHIFCFFTLKRSCILTMKTLGLV